MLRYEEVNITVGCEDDGVNHHLLILSVAMHLNDTATEL